MHPLYTNVLLCNLLVSLNKLRKVLYQRLAIYELLLMRLPQDKYAGDPKQNKNVSLTFVLGKASQALYI